MADVFARRGNDLIRWDAEPGDSLIARVHVGTMWPPDYRAVCFWKGGAEASPGRHDSKKAAAQAAYRAWVSAGHPKVVAPA